MNYTIRDFQISDKPKIFELFKISFSKNYPADLWDYLNSFYPMHKPIIKLAFNNDQLIGHYLLRPMIIRNNFHSIPVLFSMTTMTHPDFSGQGIMTMVASQAYQTGLNKKFQFVFGFANSNSKHMFLKKLGFFQIQQMTKLVSKKTDFCLKTSYDCQIATNFNKLSKSDFSNKLKNIMISRTSNYISNRFLKHPVNEYFTYIIFKENMPIGYFVLKIYKNECHLIDFILTDDINCYNIILNQISSICKKYCLSVISLWKNQNSGFMSYLESQNFKSELTEVFFICKNLTQEISSDFLSDFSNWYITMSDSDVF